MILISEVKVKPPKKEPKSTSKRKLIGSKEVVILLKVNPELVTYLRQFEGLPFVKNSKYILFSEPEVIRWRNRRLTTDSVIAFNLREYYDKTGMVKFIDFQEFRSRVEELTFLDGDNVIQYIKRQNPMKTVQNLVGTIVHDYWYARAPKCECCGKKLISTLNTKLCSPCKKLKMS